MTNNGSKRLIEVKMINLNKDHMEINKVSNKPPFIELNELVEKGFLETQGLDRFLIYVIKSND